MRMRGVNFASLILATVLLTHPAQADIKEDLKTCFMNKEWLMGFIPCATAKFSNMVENIDKILPGGLPDLPFPIQMQSVGSTGRKLLAHTPLSTSFLPPDAEPGKPTNIYHDFMEAAQATHGEFEEALLNELKSFPSHTVTEEADVELLRALAKVDYLSLFNAFNAESISSLFKISGLAMQYKTHMNAEPFSIPPSTYGIKGTLESLQGTLPLLCFTLKATTNAETVAECNELQRMVSCMANKEEAVFEDGLEWTECLFQCKDMPALSQCMVEQFSTNLKCTLPWPIKDITWVAAAAMKVLSHVVKQDKCFFEMKSPEPGTNMTLTEGDNVENVELSLFYPPAVYCMNIDDLNTPLGIARGLKNLLTRNMGKCNVRVEIATQTYLDDLAAKIPRGFQGNFPVPICGNNTARRQAVLGWHDHATEEHGSGVIPITMHNWNKAIKIPLAATIDSKPTGDGISKTFLAVRLKAGGIKDWKVQHSERYAMDIIDMEYKKKGETTCNAFAYGQMNTFDEVIYDNLFLGHFYLYKHLTKPYEVQVVYQECNPDLPDSITPPACACAAAVKFGDDVFVVDKCRRKDEDWSNIARTRIFQNGDISKNIKVLRKYEGLKFQILLPEGMFVTIVVQEDSINVHLMPSATAMNQARGLCGNYNNDKTDDLVKRDETMDTSASGIPKEFIKSWRVPKDEQILQGALANEANAADSLRYCTCSHTIFIGASCKCGNTYLMETCDRDMKGDFTERLAEITTPSLNEYAHQTGEDIIDEIWFGDDEMKEPEDSVWNSDSGLTDSIAQKTCEEEIATDPLISKLMAQGKGLSGWYNRRTPNKVLKHHAEACRNAIKASSNHKISYAPFVDAVRQKAWDQVYQTNDVLGQNMTDWDCPNNCNEKKLQGECVQGSCVCSQDFMGPSCSHKVSEGAAVDMPKTVLCDTRTEDCIWVQIFGKNFKDDSSIEFKIQDIIVNENGSPIHSGRRKTGESKVISPTQAAGLLPEEGHYSIEVSVKHPSPHSYRQKRAVSASSMFVFLSFDAQCYKCDAVKQTCMRKTEKDHCVIGGMCIPSGAVDPTDPCYLCNPHQESGNDWSVVDSDECSSHHASLVADKESEMRLDTIRLVTAIVLCGSVVVATIVLYVLVGRRTQTVKAERQRMASTNSTLQKEKYNNGVPGAVSYSTDNTGGRTRGLSNPAYRSQHSAISDADYDVAL